MLLALPMRTMDVGRIAEDKMRWHIGFNKAIVGIEISACIPRNALNSNFNESTFNGGKA